MYFLNSRYTEANASKPILEFLDLIRTNDLEQPYETPLGQMARERIQEVRSDKKLEVSYMTYAQKMMDERRVGYMDGLEDGRAEGMEKGFKDTIIALKDILDPAVIAERFKMSLEQVMDKIGRAHV